MKFLDLFSGIGGFRLGMEAAGHECIGFCEIDKFARASYKAIHNTEGEIELHDITRVSDDTIRRIGRVDIICAGFPCQAFSVAGKRKGFEDTRGTLFFEVARFAHILQPKYLFIENVKGLLSHKKGQTFKTILRTLDELGYDVEWQLLNSTHFGTPQKRKRVYIIGHLRGASGRAIFPIAPEGNAVNGYYSFKIKRLGNINPSHKGMNGVVYDSLGLAPTLTTNKGEGIKIVQRGRGYNKGAEYDIFPTLTSNSYQENNFVKIYDFYNKTEKDIVGTLTANGYQGNTTMGTFGVNDGVRIRKLTPKECWRLQTFPDWAFERAAKVNSNSQLYKQAGNSVTVNVIKVIAKNLK